VRRADRLFQIVQYLRGRRLTTAAQLAEWLSVAPRTIYRDIRDLSRSGVPVEGEAGVGYRLRAGYDLPPLMFTRAELEALATGARMVASWGGPELSSAAGSALSRIAAALPEAARIDLERTRLYAPAFASTGPGAIFDQAHRAITRRSVLRFDYQDRQGLASQREVWPLGLFFWGGAWTLAAWCCMREDFRQFRLDRIEQLQDTGAPFADTSGRRLEDFIRKVRSEPVVNEPVAN